jgi:DegV family protein with EDD domain
VAAAYDIYTDSAGDFNADQLAVLETEGVTVLDIPFCIGNYDSDKDEALVLPDFYGRIVAGEAAHTAAITRGRFYEAFETSLSKGRDVLYLGFTSGASSTYNESVAAAEMLEQGYPDRKVLCVDTLAASQGIAILVMKAIKLRQKGMSIDAAAQWINDNKLRVHHIFSVDDLTQLANGGRLPQVLRKFLDKTGLKLILKINHDGAISLEPTAIARSIEGSYKRMVNIAVKTGHNLADQIVTIVDGNNRDGASTLSKNIAEKCAGIIHGNVGPAIGCHTGPSVIALFFWGGAR